MPSPGRAPDRTDRLTERLIRATLVLLVGVVATMLSMRLLWAAEMPQALFAFFHPFTRFLHPRWQTLYLELMGLAYLQTLIAGLPCGFFLGRLAGRTAAIATLPTLYVLGDTFVPYGKGLGVALWGQMMAGLIVGPPWLARTVARRLDRHVQDPRWRAVTHLPDTLGPPAGVLWPGLCCFVALSLWLLPLRGLTSLAVRGVLLGPGHVAADAEGLGTTPLTGALETLLATAGTGVFLVRRLGYVPPAETRWRLRAACATFMVGFGCLAMFFRDGLVPRLAGDLRATLVGGLLLIPRMALPGLWLGLSPWLLRGVARRLAVVEGRHSPARILLLGEAP